MEEQLRAAVSKAVWMAEDMEVAGIRLSQMASDLAEAVYESAPEIWSELVNRETSYNGVFNNNPLVGTFDPVSLENVVAQPDFKGDSLREAVAEGERDKENRTGNRTGSVRRAKGPVQMLFRTTGGGGRKGQFNNSFGGTDNVFRLTRPVRE